MNGIWKTGPMPCEIEREAAQPIIRACLQAVSYATGRVPILSWQPGGPSGMWSVRAGHYEPAYAGRTAVEAVRSLVRAEADRIRLERRGLAWSS